MPPDPFALSIAAVGDLMVNPINKASRDAGIQPEGVEGEEYDALRVNESDEDLLKLRDEYEKRYAPYEAILRTRVDKIRASYLGRSRDHSIWLQAMDTAIASNLQFEAAETFLAAALSRNPSPVVYCDNTTEGNAIADAVKTMLQFHADQLVLRRKLTFMTRQWSMDLLGVLKPGWNDRVGDVTIENRKVREYIFDPDGYVDAYGDFSSWYGERISVTAERLIELFPKKSTYIKQICDNKLGTDVVYTEWWPNDDYCFYTFKEIVLDKHKNQYFKYPEPVLDAMGAPMLDPMTGEPQMTNPRNHFAYPKKPGIFLSVYSMQEHPHDITSNTEQNMPQQNRITRGTEQIDFNISASNNGYAFNEENFNQETGKQASNARKMGNPILVPAGGPMDQAILALPAQPIPSEFFTQVETAKNDLRTSWGTQGITAQPQDEDQTARGMILNQSHDTSRIGGGIGDAIEQVADNTFNWLVQLYYVFYDEKHFAVIMGNAKAVEYIELMSADMDRQVVVSVSPDSMKPKDDITQMNLAQALFDKGAIGPKVLLKMVDFPDVDDAAADGVLWKIDPMSYFKLNFPEYAQKLQAMQQQEVQQQNATGQAAMASQVPGGAPAPEAITEPPPATGVSTPPTSDALSNVPLQ